ncbi:MAG: hypothetical protein J2P36_36215 [Ktedonobacteraceae bacterium]|nr:hypothetical protein [Ktedonobacteraceae bacterium]
MKKVTRMICLLLVLLVLITAIALIVQNYKWQSYHLYTYGDYSSSIPSQLSPGGTITITWRSFPDSSATPVEGSTPIMLTTMLVSVTAFEQEVCGAYRSPIVLNVLQTNDETSAWYTRQVQIPLHQRAGIYELVRQVKKGPVSYCWGSRLVLLPS